MILKHTVRTVINSGSHVMKNYHGYQSPALHYSNFQLDEYDIEILNTFIDFII